MMTGTDRPVADWDGAYRSYDLVKEIVVALGIVTLLVVALAALFAQPERSAVTFEEWATNDPSGFVATTLDELTGVSATATYGPPYTSTPGAAQSLLGISPQQLAGRRIPIDTGEDLVLRPLARLATPEVASAIAAYRAAGPDQRSAWETAYRTAIAAGTSAADGTAGGPEAGPLPVMMSAMVRLAQSGAVDAALLDDTGRPGFFVLDYTRAELYLADGDYFASLGTAAGVAGDQWGMAATLGNWPGQVWLLPVAFWYQIPPGSASGNGDLIVLAIVGVLGLGFVFLPYVPGLRDLPRRLRVYRLIWRRHYEREEAGMGGASNAAPLPRRRRDELPG